eukprot:506255-Amphidinium_carterae.1
MPPRVLRKPEGNGWVVLTDASAEPFSDGVRAVVGGILLRRGSVAKVEEHFMENVPASFLEKWLTGGRVQPIAQAELLAVVAAKRTWSHVLHGQRVIFGIDNAAARACLIKGGAHEHNMKALALQAC